MKETDFNKNNGKYLRYGIMIPLALMIASFILCCFSYSNAKQEIADDLNIAVIQLTNDNKELWTKQDTIAALRQLHKTSQGPVIYKAPDLNFRNPALQDSAYISLTLVENPDRSTELQSNTIASDSILLIPEKQTDGFAIRVQGFADCSVASVITVSDQRFPGILLALSILSMTFGFVWRRKDSAQSSTETYLLTPSAPTLDGIKLTPMQRRLTQMLLDAPKRKVDKATLCSALWGNKINAEESLYTLVKRTKSALEESGIEIVCNRGESYEIRINN